MKDFVNAVIGTAALMVAGSNSAEAGGRVSIGYNPVYSFNRGYASGYGPAGLRYNGRNYNRQFSYGHLHHDVNPWVNPGHGHYDWHNTSHWDYVPGGLQRHGNHFHYQPGGWIYHQDGHWDLHH
jgi:hypothetical protein